MYHHQIASSPPLSSAMTILKPASASYSQSLTSHLAPLKPQFLPTDRALKILAMAPKKKVNRYDANWKKQWFGAGIFVEGSEEMNVDVFKKIEKKKVLSNVEKSGLLTKAEELGFTLSSIEKLGLLSKAEQLGLLSLVESAAGFSPSALASVSLPLFVAAIITVVLIPDDSVSLVILQTAMAGVLSVGAFGLLLGSVVLSGLQEAD